MHSYMPARFAHAARWALLGVPLAATLIGYFAHSLFDPGQLPGFVTLAVVAVAINGLGLVVRMLHGGIPVSIVVGLAWLAAAVFHAGLGASAGVALLTLGAMGIGSLGANTKPDGLAALLFGLAMLSAIVGWLLPFPIHTRLAYSLVAAVVIAARARQIGQILASEASALVSAVGEAPRAAFVAINVIGVCSTPLWLPTMQADDIAYHLALPFQLQDLSFYRMDVAGSIWALAPWAADVVQAIAQVLAGEEARGAANLMWMLALYAGMWRLARSLSLPPILAWAAMALHSSLPLTSSLLAGMQTELPSSALMLALVLAIAEMEKPTRHSMYGIAAVAGLLVAIKLTNALLLIPVAIWLIMRVRFAPPWRFLPASTLLGAFVALPSFTYAYIVTGNPFFPLLNGIFRSPHFVLENWKDTSWLHPVDATLPWQLTFDTPSFLAAGEGAAGFAYLLCVPGLAIALCRARYRPIAAIGIGGFALIFAQIHFIRYTHPVTSFLILGATAGFHSIGLQRALVGAVSILCALNLTVINSGYWQLRDGVLRMFLKAGKDETLRVFAPQRVIAERIRVRDDGTSRVLFHKVDAGGNAELTLPALTTSWYNRKLMPEAIAADSDDSGGRWRALFRENSITVLVTDRNKVSNGLKASLQEIGTPAPELSSTDYQAWRIAPAPAKALKLLPGHVAVEYSTFNYDRASPGAQVTTSARFRCDLPGEPIVISMAAVRASGSGQENLISGWAMCQEDGYAEGEIEAAIPADTRSLVFIAWPRSRMSFELLESHSEAREGALLPASSPAESIRNRMHLD